MDETNAGVKLSILKYSAATLKVQTLFFIDRT